MGLIAKIKALFAEPPKPPKHQYGIIYDESGAQVAPALKDSANTADQLSAREMDCVYHNVCPDCGGQIRWGPCGGAMQMIKCFGKCNAEFTVSQNPYFFPLATRTTPRRTDTGDSPLSWRRP